MYAGLIGAVAVSVLLIFLAGIYTRLYRVDYSVKELGKILLVVFALYAPVKVENMILGGGIIRSGGNTKIIMMIDIVGTWCIGIPLCFLAAYVFRWEIVGVYTLLTAEEIFRLVVSLIIFKKRKWMISLSQCEMMGMDYIKEKLFRQLAVDYCCSVSDIKDNKNHFTEYKTLEGRRQFEKVDDDLKRW